MMLWLVLVESLGAKRKCDRVNKKWDETIGKLKVTLPNLVSEELLKNILMRSENENSTMCS